MAELRLHFDLRHPRQRVWRALTEPWLISQWFMATDLSPREGSEFELQPGGLPGFLGPVTGEVVAVSAPERLVMRWQGEKLYTRVSWRLLSEGDGCRLVVVQTGFVGAPAALRIAALRTTYAELFDNRLPELLDRMAAAEPAAADPSPPRPPLLRPPAPSTAETRRRRLRANAATTVWEATAQRDVRANRPARVEAARVESARVESARVEPSRVESARLEPSRRRRSAPLAGHVDGPTAATAWLRSLAIGGVAALVAAVVFAAVVYPLDDPGGPPPVGKGPPPDGPAEPGMAVQPGTAPVDAGADTGHGAPAGPVAPSSAGGFPYSDGRRSDGSVTGAADRPVVPPTSAASSPGPPVTPTPAPPAEGSPPEGSPPEGSPPDGSPPEESAVFDATMNTAGLPLLGGRSVVVTVDNSGSAAAEWTVTMQVGAQDVVNVTGAEYLQDGDQATFTAPTGLSPGESQVFRFQLRAPLLGLLGARDPTDCQIDGRSCG